MAAQAVLRKVEPHELEQENTLEVEENPGGPIVDDLGPSLNETHDEKNNLDTNSLHSSHTVNDQLGNRPIPTETKRLWDLHTLARNAYSLFEHSGNIKDIDEAISYWETAIAGMLESDINRSGTINSLGCARWARFGRFGQLSDLSQAVILGEEAIALTSTNDPNRHMRLSNLGNSYQARFGRLGEISDLSRAIACGTEAAALTPDDHPYKPERISNLGASYLARFDRLDDLLDLNKAVEYGLAAVSSTPAGHPSQSGILSNLGVFCRTRFRRLGELKDLNKSIECGETAASLTPSGHPNQPAILGNLGLSYRMRFQISDDLLDLSKGIECVAEAASLIPDGHPSKITALSSLGISYLIRYERLGEVQDMSRAVEFIARATSLTPTGHPEKPGRLSNLAVSYQVRFKRLREISDLNTSIDYGISANLSTPLGHPDKARVLNTLGISYRTRFEELGELSDLNSAIECAMEAASLVPIDHPDMPTKLINLGNSHQARFECLGEPSDLDKAIECGTKAISLIPDGHPDRPAILSSLGTSYQARFEQLGAQMDLESAQQLFSSAALSPIGPPIHRFKACCSWARLSMRDPRASPQIAYQHAVDLLPRLVWIGTRLERRYELIGIIGDFATEAASYAISTGAYDLALEWLEAGRSIVWSQTTQLRAPIEELGIQNYELAKRLREVGRQLAGPQLISASIAENAIHDLDREASNHVGLALEWERLLTEIRSTPGFEDFMRTPKSSQLLNAAVSYPIVVINIHKSRCDALILKPGSNVISHVPLASYSIEMATRARHGVDSLVRERKIGHLSKSAMPLDKSLHDLWAGIVKPILDFLGYTQKLPIEQLPRLTWCTTSLLSFLPLHAAESCDGSGINAFDLVVSSYTPTLSTLLSSKSSGPNSPCSILAVGQERTPGLSSLPFTKEELTVINKYIQEGRYLRLEDDRATVNQVLAGMDRCSWLHMACHGSQDTTDPIQSAFHLHDGNLTLSAITRRSFTNKGLAFLSACQTAVGSQFLPDEAVHLAAGMMMAGYPSVIGTMWSIADEDGPEVAERVYAELLKDGKMDHMESARALHQAVAHLRIKLGEKDISRWAPFIHFGL